jgi:hypothetical protein
MMEVPLLSGDCVAVQQNCQMLGLGSNAIKGETP